MLGVLDDVRHVRRPEQLQQLPDDGGHDGAGRHVAHAELGGGGDAEGDDEHGCVEHHCDDRHEDSDPPREHGAAGSGAATERRQDRRGKHGDPGGRDEQQATQPCLHRVGSTVTRNRPGDVHRVLQRLSDTEGAVQRDQATDDHGGAAAMESLRVAQLVADDRELAQRRVEDPLLQVAVVLEQEPEQRRQQEQQREERQEAVERDQRRQIRTLVLEELVDHREGEPGPTMSPLVPVEPLCHLHAGAPPHRFSARSAGTDAGRRRPHRRVASPDRHAADSSWRACCIVEMRASVDSAPWLRFGPVGVQAVVAAAGLAVPHHGAAVVVADEPADGAARRPSSHAASPVTAAARAQASAIAATSIGCWSNAGRAIVRSGPADRRRRQVTVDGLAVEQPRSRSRPSLDSVGAAEQARRRRSAPRAATALA